MHQRIAIFATALALPAVATIVWMLVPAPHLDADPAPAAATPIAAPESVVPDTRARVRVSEAPPEVPGTPRPHAASPDLNSQGAAAFAPAPAPPLATPGSISPRYTLNTQPNAATLARRLEGHPSLARDERIRVLPAANASAEDSQGASINQAATANGAVLLALDATAHDPAAWVDDGVPLGEKREEVKAKIASEFAAEVAAATKQPEVAGKSFDDTWKAARAKANWEYQMFFGGEAANRAGMAAGRMAIPAL